MKFHAKNASHGGLVVAPRARSFATEKNWRAYEYVCLLNYFGYLKAI